MKKLLFIFALFSILFVSCAKKEAEEVKKAYPKDLAGSVYKSGFFISISPNKLGTLSLEFFDKQGVRIAISETAEMLMVFNQSTYDYNSDKRNGVISAKLPYQVTLQIPNNYGIITKSNIQLKKEEALLRGDNDSYSNLITLENKLDVLSDELATIFTNVMFSVVDNDKIEITLNGNKHILVKDGVKVSL